MPTPRGYVGAPIYQPNLVPQNPMNNTYVGERYVPKFYSDSAGTPTWDITKTYEPLTIVTYQGDSYTSRTYVPAGVQIDNIQFWAPTGIFNAQLEQYRMEVNHLNNEFNDYVFSNNVNYKRLQNRKILLLTNIYAHTVTQTIISKYGLNITEIYSATAGFGTGTWVDIISSENIPNKSEYTDIIFYGIENEVEETFNNDINAISTYLKNNFVNAQLYVYAMSCLNNIITWPSHVNVFFLNNFLPLDCQGHINYIGNNYWNTSNMPNSNLINIMADCFYRTILNNMTYNNTDFNIITFNDISNSFSSGNFVIANYRNYSTVYSSKYVYNGNFTDNSAVNVGNVNNIHLPTPYNKTQINVFGPGISILNGTKSYAQCYFLLDYNYVNLQTGIRVTIGTHNSTAVQATTIMMGFGQSINISPL